MAIQKPEWFPMDAAKFLSDSLVDSMTPQELGAATRLLCRQWIEGFLPDDLHMLARLSRLDDAAMAEAWVVLQKFFPAMEPGKRANRFMWIKRETVIAELDRKSDAGTRLANMRWNAARNAGGIAARMPDAQPAAMPVAMQEKSRADETREEQTLPAPPSKDDGGAKKAVTSEVSEPAGPTDGKVKSSPTKRNPKPKKQTDQRFAPTRALLTDAFHEVCSTTEPPPWDGHCGKELTDWLANHSLDLPAIEALIRNVAKSEKADQLLRDPAVLIPHLRKYSAPLDRYGVEATSRTDGRKVYPVGVHAPAPPEPTVEWRVHEPLDIEAGQKLWESAKGKVRDLLSDTTAFDTQLRPLPSLGLGLDTGTLHVRLLTKSHAEGLDRFDAPLREVLRGVPYKFVSPEPNNHPEVSSRA